MNVYLPNLRLPNTYQEVEYIQSSGTQYINTMVSMNPMYGIEIQYQLVSFSSWATLFGTRSGAIQRYTGRYYETVSDTSIEGFQVQISPDGTTSNYGRVNLKPFNGTDLNVNIIKITNRDVYLNGDLKGSMGTSSYTGTFSNPLFLFATNSDGSAIDKSIIKLFYFKIYDSSGNIIHDFVPCYRKQDGVIGLYNLVNNQFYTNSGTGTFSKGNDVTMSVLKNAYIGEVWTPGSNTLLYMEFNNNLNDSSGKGVSISGSGIGYEDIGNKKCVKLTSLTGEITGPGNLMSSVGTGDFAVSFYIKPVTSNNVPSVFQSCNTASPRNGCFMFMGFNPSNFTKDRVAFYVNDSNKSTTSVTCTSLVGSWHHFLFTRYNGVCYGYIDGSSVLTPYSDSTSLSNVGYQWILNRAGHNDQKWQNTGCCMSELIVEKQGWDSSKAIHYFDITKSNYGL